MNFLIVLMDDVGVDQLEFYNVGSGPWADTSLAIDDIVADGVRFNRAYGNSACSPTRATIQTGRYSFRTGMTTALGDHEDFWLGHPTPIGPGDEYALPEMIKVREPDYDGNTAYFGKWHLVSEEETNFDPSDESFTHPNDEGWDYFYGETIRSSSDYEDWYKVVDGAAAVNVTNYMTTETFQDAIDRFTVAPIIAEPWVMMVAPKPPHKPYHCPPYATPSGCTLGTSTDPEMFRSALEALDYELSRLIAEIDSQLMLENTTIILLSDNGSFWQSIDSSSGIPRPTGGQRDIHKGTPYELGNRVPLIIAGAAANGQEGTTRGALVQTTDLFATIAELAGVPFLGGGDDPPEDSKSIVPLLNNTASSIRTYAYSEIVLDNDATPPGPGLGPYNDTDTTDNWDPGESAHTVRNLSYRLVHRDDAEYELYDLSSAKWETISNDRIAVALGVLNLTGTEKTNFCQLRTKLEQPYPLERPTTAPSLTGFCP